MADRTSNYIGTFPRPFDMPAEYIGGTGGAVPTTDGVTADEIITSALLGVGFDPRQAEAISAWIVGEVRLGRPIDTPVDTYISELRSGSNPNQDNRAWSGALAAYDERFRWVRDLVSSGAIEASGVSGRSPERFFLDYRVGLDQIIRTNQLPGELSDPDHVAALINGGVSLSEAADRVDLATNAINLMPDYTKSLFSTYYGVSENALAGYFLDPDNVGKDLVRRSQTVQTGGIARQMGYTASRTEAEYAFGSGLGDSGLRDSFARAAALSSLQFGYGEAMSRDSLLRASFGEQDQLARLRRVANSRIAGFSGSSGFTATNTGITGMEER